MTEFSPGLKWGPNCLIKNYSRLPFKYKFGTFTGRDVIYLNFLYDRWDTNKYSDE